MRLRLRNLQADLTQPTLTQLQSVVINKRPRRSTGLFLADHTAWCYIFHKLPRYRAKTFRQLMPNRNLDTYFLASIVEHSNDSIITINLEMEITSWNKAAELLYGY